MKNRGPFIGRFHSQRPWGRYRSSAALFLLLVAWATPASAIDRETARIRRILVGRNDVARIAVLNSIASDSQGRRNALPVISDALLTLNKDGHFLKLEKQGLPALPGGVLMMIQCVGSVENEDATQLLVDLLDSNHLTWAMASMQTLGKHQHHSAIDDIHALHTSDRFENHYGFRFTLARSLKMMNHPDAWEALADLFPLLDGQLAHLLDEEFRSVTVEDFRDDAERFASWQNSLGLNETADGPPDALARAIAILNDDAPEDLPMPKRMSLQQAPSSVSYRQRVKLKPSHYYGIEIYAKRLVFIIDRSDSMNDLVYGQTRIAKAKRELIGALEGLDEQVDFGIIVFDENVRVWREELVPADKENKLSAIRFVERLSAGSTTNTYGALRRSLSFDPQLEAIFLLTDGNPTSGIVTNKSAILLDILRRNEISNITINTIAIAVDPLTASFLQNLSEPSNGEFKHVK